MTTALAKAAKERVCETRLEESRAVHNLSLERQVQKRRCESDIVGGL
jgi:hypothetical protein